MNFITKMFSSAAAEPIEAVGNVFDKLFTSDEEKLVAAQAMEKIRQHPQLVQSEINKVEASHRSVFVAGWRPFIGWVCGVGLGYVWLLRPIMMDIATLTGQTLTFSVIDTANMLDLVIALLGLGALRTIDKATGRSK